MIHHRERPRCRQIILTFLREFDCSLEELLDRKDVYLSKLQKIQARKMQREAQFRTALEIYREKRQERIMRYVEMIR